MNPYIEHALRLSAETLATKTKSEEGYTFLHALASFTRDRKVLRDQLVAVLLAGRDTTASALSWTFYELARHPDVVVKLRQEIMEYIGLNRSPTYHDLKNMKYLQVRFLWASSSTKRFNVVECHEQSSPPLPSRPFQRSLCSE